MAKVWLFLIQKYFLGHQQMYDLERFYGIKVSFYKGRVETHTDFTNLLFFHVSYALTSLMREFTLIWVSLL